MTDNLPTVWEAEPHTLAKHGILRTYLEAWTAILSNARFGTELLFVDGFAGPGEYLLGEPGSPIVALNSILNHDRTLLKKIRLRFIEKDRERHAHLVSRLVQEQDQIVASQTVIVEPPILGDCDAEISKLIAERRRQGQMLGPALFFLDQFGYSQVPMSLVQHIMEHQWCEVFSYLNCQRMNHFLSDRTKWAGITAAYGDESWKAALAMNGDARQQSLIRAYMDAIRANAGVVYVWSFAMFDTSEHLINWLIFGTNNLRGLEVMKSAMWKSDQTGDYRFSDRVDKSGQQSFFSNLKPAWLADELAAQLAGRTMKEEEVREFVVTKTPFYLYKSAVNLLRADGRATPAKKANWPVKFADRG